MNHLLIGFLYNASTLEWKTLVDAVESEMIISIGIYGVSGHLIADEHCKRKGIV